MGRCCPDKVFKRERGDRQTTSMVLHLWRLWSWQQGMVTHHSTAMTVTKTHLRISCKGRAEAAMKTKKRIMTDNTDMFGQLDRIARALLLPRNTLIQDVGVAPAVMLLGHLI